MAHLVGFGLGSAELDLLQGESTKLVALLQDRQPGMLTWNQFLSERLTRINELTSKALGK